MRRSGSVVLILSVALATSCLGGLDLDFSDWSSEVGACAIDEASSSFTYTLPDGGVRNGKLASACEYQPGSDTGNASLVVYPVNPSLAELEGVFIGFHDVDGTGAYPITAWPAGADLDPYADFEQADITGGSQIMVLIERADSGWATGSLDTGAAAFVALSHWAPEDSQGTLSMNLLEAASFSDGSALVLQLSLQLRVGHIKFE